MNTSNAPTNGTIDAPDNTVDTAATPAIDTPVDPIAGETTNTLSTQAPEDVQDIPVHGPTADALAALAQHANPERAIQMAKYHKQKRTVLGVSNEILNTLCKPWRLELDLSDRIALAQGLWQSDVFEAQILAAKLLTQARIKDDGPVWDLMSGWVAEIDSWAIAEHACSAISKRLIANPDRLEQVQDWTTSDHMWTRLTALMATLPWAKLPNPKPHELEARDRILGWAAGYVTDKNLFMQKAIATWVRDLSKHDTERATAFMIEHGATLKPVARKEALRHLPHVHITVPTPPLAPTQETEADMDSTPETDAQSNPETE